MSERFKNQIAVVTGGARSSTVLPVFPLGLPDRTPIPGNARPAWLSMVTYNGR